MSKATQAYVFSVSISRRCIRSFCETGEEYECIQLKPTEPLTTFHVSRKLKSDVFDSNRLNNTTRWTVHPVKTHTHTKDNFPDGLYDRNKESETRVNRFN